MAESKPGEEIEERLEHDVAELDERIDRLGDHIGEAKQKARERADEATPLEEATGDFEDEPGPPADMTTNTADRSPDEEPAGEGEGRQ